MPPYNDADRESTNITFYPQDFLQLGQIKFMIGEYFFTVTANNSLPDGSRTIAEKVEVTLSPKKTRAAGVKADGMPQSCLEVRMPPQYRLKCVQDYRSYQIPSDRLHPEAAVSGVGSTKHLESSQSLFEAVREGPGPAIVLPVSTQNNFPATTTLSQSTQHDFDTTAMPPRRQKYKKKANKKRAQAEATSEAEEMGDKLTTFPLHRAPPMAQDNVVEQFAHYAPVDNMPKPRTAPIPLDEKSTMATDSGKVEEPPVAKPVTAEPTHKERLAIQTMEKAAEVHLEMEPEQTRRLTNSLESPSFPTLGARMKVTFARMMALARAEAAQGMPPPAIQEEDVMTATEAEVFLAVFSEVRDEAGRLVGRRYFRLIDRRVTGGMRGVGAVAAASNVRSGTVSAKNSKKARLDELVAAGKASGSIVLVAEVKVNAEGRGGAIVWMK